MFMFNLPKGISFYRTYVTKEGNGRITFFAHHSEALEYFIEKLGAEVTSQGRLFKNISGMEYCIGNIEKTHNGQFDLIHLNPRYLFVSE